ncbi:UNC93-like protein MFSD11 [Homalodisca vitripennis]|uniref:UNC93-like protein MFSD11 n=1 Tax=Homalodisca vitripennis TaxID=197043 RepID=UPI001EEA8B52|nr:UNC93-like protein MFSD11 [Homalodisca vitripennis]
MSIPSMKSEIVKSAYIGFCFMVLYSGFYTLSNLEKLFLTSARKENPSFNGDGYISLAIVFVSYSASMWLVLPIISVCGTKLTFVAGSLGYSLFIASFLTESSWLLYAGSACCGVGSAMIWPIQGNYMILISSNLTITRNLSIFNIIWQSSLFYGNILALFVFQDKEYLDKQSRTTVILALLGISASATLFLLFLPTPTSSDGKDIKEDYASPIVALKKTWEVAITKYMLILFIPFVFMGFQVCFMSGVYGSCVGFTKQLEHSEQLVPLIGLIIGVGEIVSALCLICVGKHVTSWIWGQTVVMIVALVIEYSTFILIFLNLPNNSVFGETSDSAILPSSWWNAVLAAFLIGLSDGIYMSMIPSMIGLLFPSGSVYGCAVFTFILSVFSSVGFFSSNYIGLYWQLLILAVTATLGALCYAHVSLDVQRRVGKQEETSKL